MLFRWISLFLLFAALVRAEDAPLALNDVYTLALERSETLQIGEAEWRAAEARYQRALKANGPDVHAEGLATFREGNRNRASESYGLGVGTSWTLYDGFGSVRDGEARKAEGEAIRFETARTRQLLYEDCADAYFEALARRGETEALRAQQAAVSNRVAELEKRVALGRSRRAELLAAQSQVAELDVAIATADTLNAEALELLGFLTGRPAAQLNLATPGDLPPAEAVELVLANETNRPDLRAAAKRVEAAQRDVDAARAEKSARVTANANVYVWRSPSEEDQWDLGLRAELPLFDRGVRNAAMAERLQSVRVRELRLTQLQRMADRDIQRAWRETRGGLAQWVALERAIDVTRQSHEQQQRDYEMGRASNLDVLAALTQLHALRRQEAVLRMRILAANVRLQVAIGDRLP